MLDIQDVSVHYGGITALQSVDIEVGEHDLVVVVGANGAGKSTLFKAISGTVPVASGRIRFEGIDLATLPPFRRARLGIAHVPEGRRMFASMSVEDNLIVGAMGSRSVRPSLDSVYELFPMLLEHRARRAGQLSGGQQQMVALGRALMAKPRLMMIDEPSMGLAPAVVEAVFDRVAEINRGGTAILLVEQRAAEALEISQRGYVLERGRVVLAGPSFELARDERVRAAYLGA